MACDRAGQTSAVAHIAGHAHGGGSGKAEGGGCVYRIQKIMMSHPPRFDQLDRTVFLRPIVPYDRGNPVRSDKPRMGIKLYGSESQK